MSQAFDATPFADTQLVIFDWDGTLMDSIGKIVAAVQAAAVQMQVPVPSEQQSRSIIGLSLENAFATLFPGQEALLHSALGEAYKQQYRALEHMPSPLFHGAEAMLVALAEQNKTLAVATGKGRPGLDRLLKETGLAQYFAVTRTCDEARSKPDPDMLQQILAVTSIAAGQAVMVGDTKHDINMAKALHMPSIAVSFGAESADSLKLSTPTRLVDCLTQLPPLFSRC